MRLINIAIHHSNRLSGQSSIASACLDRLSIDRPLETAPGYIAKNMGGTEIEVDYKCVNGLPVKKRSISDQYGVSQRLVLNVFRRNNNNYKLAHKELGARL